MLDRTPFLHMPIVVMRQIDYEVFDFLSANCIMFASVKLWQLGLLLIMAPPEVKDFLKSKAARCTMCAFGVCVLS